MPRIPARPTASSRVVSGLMLVLALAAAMTGIALGSMPLQVVSAAPSNNDGPLHVALVLDGSQSMAGESRTFMQEGAIGLVTDLALDAHGDRRVAVTEYRSQAFRMCDLTNSEDEAAACIEQVDAAGGSRLDLGVADGLAALRSGRSGSSPSPAEALVALTDGGHPAGCQPVIDAAQVAKAEGVVVYTICLGTECNPACIEPMASSSEHFHLTMQPQLLPDIFEAIATHILGNAVTPTPTPPTPAATSTATPTPSVTDTPPATETPTSTRLPTVALTPYTPTSTRVTTPSPTATRTPAPASPAHLPFAVRGAAP